MTDHPSTHWPRALPANSNFLLKNRPGWGTMGEMNLREENIWRNWFP